MIPGDFDEEVPSEIAITVTSMPVHIFEELWHGLNVWRSWWSDSGNGCPPEVEAQIKATQDWLNYTMQGRDIEQD